MGNATLRALYDTVNCPLGVWNALLPDEDEHDCLESWRLTVNFHLWTEPKYQRAAREFKQRFTLIGVFALLDANTPVRTLERLEGLAPGQENWEGHLDAIAQLIADLGWACPAIWTWTEWDGGIFVASEAKAELVSSFERRLADIGEDTAKVVFGGETAQWQGPLDLF